MGHLLKVGDRARSSSGLCGVIREIRNFTSGRQGLLEGETSEDGVTRRFSAWVRVDDLSLGHGPPP